ncbi:MAG: hypothetical protein OIF47_11665 [Marinibacterium sp.]|nr:hypothetical protein [Marinibacterium sp.]
MRVILALLLGMTLLAACSERHPYASDAEVAAMRYSDPGNPELRLITVISNRTGAGAHSALVINAQERVLFDPAGSFYTNAVAEQRDVLHGFSPRVEQYYKSAYARDIRHVVIQTIPVTAEQAQVAYELALKRGPVGAAMCTNATSGILRQVPGFEDIRHVYQPTKLMEQVAQIPGVETERYFEDDDGTLDDALAVGIDN